MDKPMNAEANQLELQTPPAIEEAKIAAHLRELRRGLEKGPLVWFLPRFLTGASLGTLASTAIPGLLIGDLRSVFDPSSRFFWLQWLAPTAVTLPTVIWAYFFVRKRVRRGVPGMVADMENQWRRLTGAGWRKKCVGIGIGMAAVGGGFIGLFTAKLISGELLGGSVLSHVGIYVAMTAGWTIPLSFAIRWQTIRSMRTFLRAGPGLGPGAAKRAGALEEKRGERVG